MKRLAITLAALVALSGCKGSVPTETVLEESEYSRSIQLAGMGPAVAKIEERRVQGVGTIAHVRIERAVYVFQGGRLLYSGKGDVLARGSANGNGEWLWNSVKVCGPGSPGDCTELKTNVPGYRNAEAILTEAMNEALPDTVPA